MSSRTPDLPGPSRSQFQVSKIRGQLPLVRPLDTWLAQEFSPQQRRHTIAKLVEQAAADAPTPPASPEGLTVAACDANLRPVPGQRSTPAPTLPWSAPGSPTPRPSVNAPRNTSTRPSGRHWTPTPRRY